MPPYDTDVDGAVNGNGNIFQLRSKSEATDYANFTEINLWNL